MKRFVALIMFVLSVGIAPAFLSGASDTQVANFFRLRNKLANGGYAKPTSRAGVIATLRGQLSASDCALLKNQVNPGSDDTDFSEYIPHIYRFTCPGHTTEGTMSLASILVVEACLHKNKTVHAINMELLRDTPGIGAKLSNNELNDSNGTRPIEHALWLAGPKSIIPFVRFASNACAIYDLLASTHMSQPRREQTLIWMDWNAAATLWTSSKDVLNTILASAKGAWRSVKANPLLLLNWVKQNGSTLLGNRSLRRGLALACIGGYDYFFSDHSMIGEAVGLVGRHKAISAAIIGYMIDQYFDQNAAARV